MSVKVDMTNETDFNTMIGQVGNMLEDMWNQYNFVFTSIRDYALVSGKANEAMSEYVTDVEALKGKYTELAEDAQFKVNEFTQDIEEADKEEFQALGE